MDSNSVNEIERISQRLEPQSPRARHHRLFGGLDFELFEEKGDWETQERKLEQRRQEAVQEILRDSSIEGVIAFARSVSQPVKVGSALGVIPDESIDAALLPNLLKEDALQDFLAGFVWSRVHSGGRWQWVDDLATTAWTEEAKVRFLVKLPFRRETWERAAQMLRDNTDPYWKDVFPNAYHVAEEDLIAAAELLLKHRRPRAAVQCLQRLAFKKLEMPPSLVARALLESISSDEPRIPFDQHACRQRALKAAWVATLISFAKSFERFFDQKTKSNGKRSCRKIKKRSPKTHIDYFTNGRHRLERLPMANGTAVLFATGWRPSRNPLVNRAITKLR
jgi:hypothetical protein